MKASTDRKALIEKYAKRLNDGIILSDKPMSLMEAKKEQLTILTSILTELASELPPDPVADAAPVAWYDLPMANIELADAIVQEWQKRVREGAPAMPWGTSELVELISSLRPALPPEQGEADERTERQKFEEFYTLFQADLERNPIGSRECHLQWVAWWHRAVIESKHLAAPEGWVLVPKEPTKEMKEAGGREFMEARHRTSTVEQQDAERIYKLMIAAVVGET